MKRGNYKKLRYSTRKYDKKMIEIEMFQQAEDKEYQEWFEYHKTTNYYTPPELAWSYLPFRQFKEQRISRSRKNWHLY